MGDFDVKDMHNITREFMLASFLPAVSLVPKSRPRRLGYICRRKVLCHTRDQGLPKMLCCSRPQVPDLAQAASGSKNGGALGLDALAALCQLPGTLQGRFPCARKRLEHLLHGFLAFLGSRCYCHIILLVTPSGLGQSTKGRRHGTRACVVVAGCAPAEKQQQVSMNLCMKRHPCQGLGNLFGNRGCLMAPTAKENRHMGRCPGRFLG